MSIADCYINKISGATDNVTCRKQKALSTHASLENNNLSNSQLTIDEIQSSTLKDTSSVSLPDISSIENSQFLDLKQENTELILQLSSANEEIAKLYSENKELRKTLAESEQIIATYKKICSDAVTIQSKILTPIKQQQNSLIRDSPVSLTSANCEDTPRVAKGERLTDSTRKKETKKVKQVPKSTIHRDDLDARKIQPKRKICFINSNPKNNILKLSDSKYVNDELCHYLFTNGRICDLLSGIETKVQNFTFNDYCIIFIGENDFNATEDYMSLIKMIRMKLFQVCTHTNIIVCLPNYKYKNYANIFNKRVEVFNSMLYLDNETHEYAYILDTNKHIDYSPSMFRRDGNINYRALNIINDDLADLIASIHSYTLCGEMDSGPQLFRESDQYSK